MLSSVHSNTGPVTHDRSQPLLPSHLNTPQPMKTFLKVGGAALLASAVLTSALTSAPQDSSIGDEVSYSFSQPILNGMGVTSLDDLRGKPVLVELWGTR